ncbi:sulfatase-modifying factor protein [filamentous cyanobacterium CCP5]|nr:sulfatase-modifying factor protein [filamentous cyanobacterium CCP5]
MAILARRFGYVGSLLLAGGVAIACGTPPAPPPLTPERCQSQTGFVFIPSGPFQAGSDAAERDYGYRISAAAIGDTPDAIDQAEMRLRNQGWFDREGEATQVDQSAFCMAKNLVTQADYQAFVAATGHRPPGISEADYQAQGFLVHPYGAVEPYLWSGGDPPDHRRDHPVVLVSYGDAIAYADWRSRQDGVRYRLPTALEWEKAARSDDGRYFPWGSTWQGAATNHGGSGLDGTSAIGAFPLSRSPYGVEDMAGNVFEYTSTRLGDGNRVVMKGCSWDDLPGFCRGAYRHSRPAASRHILFGFRLVMK